MTKKVKDRELVGGVEIRLFGKNGGPRGKRQATKLELPANEQR